MWIISHVELPAHLEGLEASSTTGRSPIRGSEGDRLSVDHHCHHWGSGRRRRLHALDCVARREMNAEVTKMSGSITNAGRAVVMHDMRPRRCVSERNP